MSVAARLWANSLPPETLKGWGRAILACLADHADRNTWLAWPTVATIAKETGAGESTVKRWLPALERYGFIRIVKKGQWKGDASTYLVLGKGVHGEPLYEDRDTDADTPKGVMVNAKGGHRDTTTKEPPSSGRRAGRRPSSGDERRKLTHDEVAAQVEELRRQREAEGRPARQIL
jgi:hypothetical protein